MVFLHGLADSHLSFIPMAAGFPNRRVILLDLPGHGLSDRPDASYTPEWYGEVLSEWFRREGLEDVDLVGHSFGGAIAQLLTHEHDEQIRSLTLLAPGGLGPEVGITLKLLTLPGAEAVVQPFFGLGVRAFMRTMVDAEHAGLAGSYAAQPGSARTLTRTSRAVIDWSGQTRFVAERAAEIAKWPPTALLWGDRDPIIPVRQASRAAKWMRGIDVRLYKNVGHFPHLERTSSVVADVSELLDAHRAPVRVAVHAIPKRRPSWIMRAWSWMRTRVRNALRRRGKRRPVRALPKPS